MREKFNKKILHLAKKYYNTTDLSKLTPFQLDKITTWATNHKSTKGSNSDRKAGRDKGRYIKGLL
jgi:hypothetical protein